MLQMGASQMQAHVANHSNNGGFAVMGQVPCTFVFTLAFAFACSYAYPYP